MDRGQVDTLISRLGEGLGMPDLALDESGTCTLVIDNGAVIVNLGHNRGAGALDLMTCLDRVELSAPNLTQLLGANLGWRATGGATFAVEPTSGAVMLQRRLTAGDATDEGLKAAIESLIAAAEVWTRHLTGDMGAPADAAKPIYPPVGSMRP